MSPFARKRLRPRRNENWRQPPTPRTIAGTVMMKIKDRRKQTNCSTVVNLTNLVFSIFAVIMKRPSLIPKNIRFIKQKLLWD